MADTADESDMKQEGLESEVKDMNIKEEGDMDVDTIALAEVQPKERSASRGDGMSTPGSVKRKSRSPTKAESMAQSPAVKVEEDDTTRTGGEVELRLEPGKPPILQRKKSQKIERRPPPLFNDYQDKTAEATSTFSTLTECTYANKYLGTTEHALECDCAEEWGKWPPK